MEKNENIEIKRILDILRNKKILIICTLIIFTILGYLYSYYYVVPKYKSSTTLLIIPNSADEDRTITNSDLTLNSGLISTYSNIAKNSKVLKQVINNLNLDISEEELLSQVQISVIKNTHIMEITVIDSDPQKALNITKEMANVFLQEIKQIYNLENIGIVDEAQLPNVPYNNNHVKDITIFFICGVLVSAFFVMIIYIFDNTIKSEEDIEKYINIKALGSIPFDNNENEIINRSNSKSYITECINTIRTNILYMNSTKCAKTILITSCTPQEGKSWTSANIATSFAETNKKVLLIDGDMRKGRANKIFNVDNTEGLSNYLYFITGNIEKDIELGKKYIKETQIPNLHILTNGTVPPNPSELLGSNEMKELMNLLKKVYDIIIVDAPPCKLVSDSIVLSTIVDSTILVADSENTKLNDLNEIKKSIDIVGGKIIGTILNKVKIKEKVYGKSYYYGHQDLNINDCEIQEKKIITVDEIINNATKKLEENNFNIYDEEDEIVDIENDNLEKNDENNYDIDRIIKNQNKYLQKVANSISDIKVQLNNNIIENKIKKHKEDNLEEYISKKIEEIQRKNNIELKAEIRNISNIFSEINDIKADYNKIIEKILPELNKENVTGEEIKEILKEEITNINNKIEINEISKTLEKIKLNYEEILPEIRNNDGNINRIFNEINNVKTEYNKVVEKIEEIQNTENIIQETNKNNIASEEIKEILKEEISNINYTEEIKEILKEEISNIDYAEQINYMNEMITNLKDSYLELSNIIRTNNIENEQINNNNIIDIKSLKKQKQKEQKQKKKVFSIEENISYTELEKTAVCVIPIQIKNDDDYYTSESYESIM